MCEVDFKMRGFQKSALADCDADMDADFCSFANLNAGFSILCLLLHSYVGFSRVPFIFVYLHIFTYIDRVRLKPPSEKLQVKLPHVFYYLWKEVDKSHLPLRLCFGADLMILWNNPMKCFYTLTEL